MKIQGLSLMDSDVNYLVLEVIPELIPGVLIHVHDWFYAYEYPKSWITNGKIFWNEISLAQTNLIGN